MAPERRAADETAARRRRNPKPQTATCPPASLQSSIAPSASMASKAGRGAAAAPAPPAEGRRTAFVTGATGITGRHCVEASRRWGRGRQTRGAAVCRRCCGGRLRLLFSAGPRIYSSTHPLSPPCSCCAQELLGREGWRVVTVSRRDLEGIPKGAAVQQVGVRGGGAGGGGSRGGGVSRALPLPSPPARPVLTQGARPFFELPTRQLKADLLDQGAVEAALREGLGGGGGERGGGITHIFHCAYLMRSEPAEECKVGGLGGGCSERGLSEAERRRRRVGMRSCPRLRACFPAAAGPPFPCSPYNADQPAHAAVCCGGRRGCQPGHAAPRLHYGGGQVVRSGKRVLLGGGGGGRRAGGRGRQATTMFMRLAQPSPAQPSPAQPSPA